MDRAAITAKVKEIIAKVTNLDPAKISESASYIDDLKLDSLSLLEIGVDVDFEFKLSLPEERLRELRSVTDTVDLVIERQQELTLAAVA